MKTADFPDLTPAEEQLCAEVGAGEIVVIGDGTRPGPEAGAARQIRAELLRALILDRVEDYPVHDKGVRVKGARITGTLDLEGCRIGRDVYLADCRFDEALVLRSARLDSLLLNRSALPGLKADRLQAKGNIVLDGLTADGEVRLLGAQLGGTLDCERAQLRAGKSGIALVADRMQAEGNVFLRGTETTGEVRLVGARLGGDLSCVGAKLHAGEKAVALSADRLSAKGTLFWRGVKEIKGVLDLTDAEFRALCDNRTSWPARGNLALNRFRYGAFMGTGTPLDAAARIDWLDRQDPARVGQDFWPQPWEQCAKVLREMGHREDARQILIAKEERQRAARRSRTDGWARYALLLWDTVLAQVTGYGYRPFRALYFLAGLWLYGAFVFGDAARVDSIKPNNPFILRSAEWAYCAPDYVQEVAAVQYAPRNGDGRSQLACFRAQPEAQGYPAFNALVYSADTLLPIVEMEMQEFWLPDDSHAYGAVARVYLWVHIALGWAFSILAVAGFTGLIRTEDTT